MHALLRHRSVRLRREIRAHCKTSRYILYMEHERCRLLHRMVLPEYGDLHGHLMLQVWFLEIECEM